MVRRKRFQRGWLLKIGKRRKVWVGRWREDVLLEGGQVGRVQRSLLLGTVAELRTRRDAQARLDETLAAVNAASSRPESSVTFGWFVEQQWTPLVFPTFKASTQHGYKNVLAKHVLPRWKNWRLRDLERLAIQQWVAEQFTRKTGWQTVRNAWVLLSGILESAVEFGYLTSNPARGVKFPQKGLRAKPAIIAGDSLAKLLAALHEPYGTMVSLIAATGLRVGELLALRWSAVDLETGALMVRESVYEGRFQPPKTQKAVRTIPLGPHAVAALLEHQARVSRKAPGDLVFGNRQGDALRESKLLTRVLQPAAKAVGLGTVTWHQFRHIHSSLLNDLKVPAKIAQEQLGHGSIATTLGIYTHAIETSHRKAVEEVEERLFGVLLRNAPKSGTAATSAAPVNANVA